MILCHRALAWLLAIESSAERYELQTIEDGNCQ